MERRRATRFQRRAPVSVTAGADAISGFMTNLSSGGAYVQASRALAPKTRIRLQIRDGGKSWAVEALVVSKKDVLPSLRVVEQPGMGIRFLRPDELLEEIIPRPAGAPARPSPSTSGLEPVAVDLTQLGRLREVEKDVRSGGMFVPSARIVEMHSHVQLAIRLPAAPEPLLVDAKVILVAPNGFAVEFADSPAVRQAFAEAATRWG